MEELTIHDYVRVAGSPSELALLLGIGTQRGIWRVSQWVSRGKIPRGAWFEHLRTWKRLAKRIAEQKVAA